MKIATSGLTIGIDASRAARAERTGTETYSLELIRALADLLPPTYHLRLYTPHPPHHAVWPVADNVTTRLIPWPRLWTHVRLAAEIWHNPPDVLFVPAHVLPFICPVPAVVTVHDLGYRHYPDAHRPFDRWYLDWTTRRHTHVAQHIVADSKATRQDLLDFYQARPEQISVVPLGRDPHLQPVTDLHRIAQVKHHYNIAGDYLLYIGTLHPRKNLVRLVEAFRQVIIELQRQDLQLVIAGKRGWLYNIIFERVKQEGLTEQVIFPGYITAGDKPALLSGALAYVFPSLYEGFGLPVLEAMACGTPVLTSNISSLPEVAGQAAILIDPHDVDQIAAGLKQLITQANLRQHYVEQGYQQIKNFSWSQAAAQILEILENVTLSR